MRAGDWSYIADDTSQKLLVLQHVAHEPLGYIAEYANEKGISIDVVKLWETSVIPPPEGYAGIIIMGGPMGVYEDFTSKTGELTLIRNVVGRVPLLGICLGSQLLAHALGAKVYPNPGGKEIGYYDLELTEAGKTSTLFRDFSPSFKALEWHGDAFDLPAGAELLVSSKACKNQAFSFKNAYGVLFHLEFTSEMVRNLIVVDREWTRKNFELDEAKLVHDAENFARLMKQQCYLLLDNFLR